MFEMDDFVECREKIWDMGAGNWKHLYRNPELMSVGNIFGEIKDFKFDVEPDWFYQIEDWASYVEILRDDPVGLDNPPDSLYKRARDWDPIDEWEEIEVEPDGG
jgi:hypothetical protein